MRFIIFSMILIVCIYALMLYAIKFDRKARLHDQRCLVYYDATCIDNSNR